MKQPKNCWAKAWARQRRVSGVWSMIIALWSRLVLKNRANNWSWDRMRWIQWINTVWLQSATMTAKCKLSSKKIRQILYSWECLAHTVQFCKLQYNHTALTLCLFAVSQAQLYVSLSSLCLTIGRPGTSFSPLAVYASFQMFWIWIFILQEIQPLLLFLSLILLCVSAPSSICVDGVLELCLLCVCVFCPLFRSPWWRGGCVAQILLSGQHQKLLNVLLDPSSSLTFYNLHFCHHNCIYCDFVVDLSIYCISVHPGRGFPPLLLFRRFLVFFSLLKGEFGEFFPDPNQGSKDRGCCMLYRLYSPWGKFVICDIGLYT